MRSSPPDQLEVTGFRDRLVLVDRVGVQLHDRVETQLSLVCKGRQHMQQVGHAAARGLIKVGHTRQWTAPGSYALVVPKTKQIQKTEADYEKARKSAV